MNNVSSIPLRTICFSFNMKQYHELLEKFILLNYV